MSATLSAALPGFTSFVVVKWFTSWSGIRVIDVGSIGLGVGGGNGLGLGAVFVVQGVEAFGFGAVKVEPPITDEVALVENGSVGAQEGVLGKAALAVGRADMESLAFGFGITIVAYEERIRIKTDRKWSKRIG